MRKLASIAAVAIATVLLLPGSASAAPTLTLEPNCYLSAEGKVYGVDILLSGLAAWRPMRRSAGSSSMCTSIRRATRTAATPPAEALGR
jgi:hypothetical protein